MRRELHTRRLSRLRRRDGRDVVMVAIAALALVAVVWILAARRPHEPRIAAAVAPAPRIVTVPVPIAVPEPAAPVPAVVPVVAHDAASARDTTSHRLAPRQPRVVTAPTVQPPPAPAAPSDTDITTQYRQVGALLKQHPDDALWQRYRWIRLGDCLSDAAKRSECARMLDQIASDARGK